MHSSKQNAFFQIKRKHLNNSFLKINSSILMSFSRFSNSPHFQFTIRYSHSVLSLMHSVYYFLVFEFNFRFFYITIHKIRNDSIYFSYLFFPLISLLTLHIMNSHSLPIYYLSLLSIWFFNYPCLEI